MSVCRENGWTENNRPECAWCRNKIQIRGEDHRIAVLVGAILLTRSGGKVITIAHFDCERHLWRAASRTALWWKRVLGDWEIVFQAFRMESAAQDPWYVSA